MRRLISLVLCVVMLLLCGCATEMDKEDSSSDQGVSDESNQSFDGSADLETESSESVEDSLASDASNEESEDGSFEQEPSRDEDESAEYFLNGFSYTVKEGKATVTAYHGKEANLTVPTDFDGFGVVAVADGAFKNNAYIEEIKVSDGVLSVGENAFSGCSKLKKLSIGKDVAFIGAGVVDDCALLENIEVSGLNTVFATKGGVLYNKEMTKLLRCPQAFEKTEFTVPESVTEIEPYAFYYCTSLKKLNLHEQITKLGAGAFYYCRSLESVSVPSLINSVDDFLCFGCLSLKKVSLPDGLVSIGEYAFFGCAALEGLSFPEGVSVAETSFEGSGVKK